ncbi:MAG: sugar phosphate isomerase/epimerase [Clostridia bacterium]|nr:sugar phosphate isomerase/epimerase [Clostridia bacterium]
MNIGICFNAYAGLEIEQQIRLMRENGFEATFVGSESPRLDEKMSAIRAAGIACESVHAPFNKINDMWYDGEAGEDMLARLMHSVDVCVKHNIPVSVVHLSSGIPAPRINDVGYDRFSRLMEYADKNNVTIAYENQRMLANIAFAFEQFPTAGFCWDVGHEACFANGRRYMPLFGDKLVQLHVHDNCEEFNSDLHLIPYDGKIDFERVARSIADTGYDRSLMLEIMKDNSDRYTDLTPEQYYKRASDAAHRLADRVEYYKSLK